MSFKEIESEKGVLESYKAHIAEHPRGYLGTTPGWLLLANAGPDTLLVYTTDRFVNHRKAAR
jgi:hypothetical protein